MALVVVVGVSVAAAEAPGGMTPGDAFAGEVEGVNDAVVPTPPLAVAGGVSEAEAAAAAVAVDDDEGDTVPVGGLVVGDAAVVATVAGGVLLAVADSDGVSDAGGVPEGNTDALQDALQGAVPEAVGGLEAEVKAGGDTLAEADSDGVALAGALLEEAGVVEGVPATAVTEIVKLGLWEADCVCDGVLVSDTELLTEGLYVPDTEPVMVGLSVAAAVPVATGVSVLVPVLVAAIDADGDGDDVRDGVTDDVRDGVSEGVLLIVGVGIAVSVVVAAAVTEEEVVGDHVGVTVLVGSGVGSAPHDTLLSAWYCRMLNFVVLPTSAPQYGCTASEAMCTDVTFSPGPQSALCGGSAVAVLPTLGYRNGKSTKYVTALVVSAK